MVAKFPDHNYDDNGDHNENGKKAKLYNNSVRASRYSVNFCAIPAQLRPSVKCLTKAL